MYMIYTEQNYKCNSFVFVPIFHELNSMIFRVAFYYDQPKAHLCNNHTV